jgi:hypothetical protein
MPKVSKDSAHVVEDFGAAVDTAPARRLHRQPSIRETQPGPTAREVVQRQVRCHH